MTREEYNQKAQLLLENFKREGVKESLDFIDKQLSAHDPNDVNFYRKLGAEASDYSNQIDEIYYELIADKNKYYARRIFELNIEYDRSGEEKTITVNGEKVKLSRNPSKELIENAVNCELADVCWVIDYLKGQLLSSINTIKTCRNHTYREVAQQEKQEEEYAGGNVKI